MACEEKEAGTAFAIVMGRLKYVDGGDPNATIYRLWTRARRILVEPARRERVICLARHLLKVRQITGEEINQFITA